MKGFCVGCLIQIAFIVLYIWLGAISVEYILSWVNKDIPMFGDIIVGLIGGSVTIPVAIIGWILKLFGVF